MRIEELNESECQEVLTRITLGRLGCCLNEQPYVVPVGFAYESDFIYVFATLGKKIEWMRANPKVCLQVDEAKGKSDWVSVIANGEYQELPDPKFAEERAHARSLLQQRHHWWLNALAERRIQMRDQDIEPVFFRIQVQSMSGLRGVPEGE